ncbi:hypothetical protein M3Y95_00286800 [Aphelenchoides besseyi]|nr:hypothetical protein M3Y95_00286800 [Aphelenchoides besseyi]
MIRFRPFAFASFFILIYDRFTVSTLISATNDTKEPLEIRWNTVNSTALIPVAIGTPGQKFNLRLIVDANCLWVYDKSCSADNCAQGIRPSNFYDSSLSSTSIIQNVSFNNLDEGSGSMFTDLITIEDSKVSFLQSFAAVKHVLRKDNSADGIVGLGIENKEESFICKLASQFDSTIFMLSMSPEVKLFDDHNGTLTIKPTERQVQQFKFVPASTDWFFKIKSATVRLRDHGFKVENQIGSIVIGSSITTGPSFVIDLIFHMTNAVEFEPNRYYVYKSKVKKIPSLRFELENGLRIALEPEDLLFEDNVDMAIKLTGRSDVRIFALKSGLMHTDQTPGWRIAENFLRRHSVIFKMNETPQIGFVASNSSTFSMWSVNVLFAFSITWLLSYL